MIGFITFGTLIVAIILLWFGLISVALFDVIFAIAMGNTAYALASKVGCNSGLATKIGFGVPIVALGVQWFLPQVQLSPYLAILIINLFVAYIFGRGLTPGRTPLIVQLIEVSDSGPEAPGAFRRYVNGQGCVWTVFGGVTAALGLIAMVTPSLRGSLDASITGLFILQIIWFILAHKWARLRYQRPETWVGTIRLMSRADVWSALKI